MGKKKHYVPYDKQGIIMEAKLKDNFKPFYKKEASINSKEFEVMIEDLRKKGVPISLERKKKKNIDMFDY